MSSEPNKNKDITEKITEDGSVSGENLSAENSAVEKETAARKKMRADKILNILLIVAVCVFVATFFIRGFVCASVRIRQTSMYPTYDNGDRVWVNKTRKLTRGTVVVFYEDEVESKFLAAFTDSDKKLIKRAVAVEGDRIWVEQQADGRFALRVRTPEGELLKDDYYVKDGEKVEKEDMLRAYLYRLADHIGEENAYTVPEGCFFAMGDNRNNSKDSRTEEIGDIPVGHLFGTVID